MFDQIKDLLIRKFQLDADHVGPGSTFSDLGLDSLDLVELSMAIDKELGAPVTDDELAETGNLGAVAELLTHRGARV